MRATTSIPEAALLIGIGRNTAYDEAKRTGELAGVPVIRVGRRMVVATALLEKILGIESNQPERVRELL